LPAYTRAVVYVSAFLVYSGQWILLAGIGTLIVFAFMTRIYSIRLSLHAILWRCPVWGTFNREESLAIFSGALKVLLGGGLPLPQAAREGRKSFRTSIFRYRAGIWKICSVIGAPWRMRSMLSVIDERVLCSCAWGSGGRRCGKRSTMVFAQRSGRTP
jgi:hypothetical protein